MAKADYYFPLYYRRLLTSTIGWTDEEFGAYLRLLIYQFDNGKIPSDLSVCKRIAPSIKKHWPLIKSKFKEDESGELYNEVMRDVYEHVQRKKENNKELGKLGGRPKRENRTVTERLTEIKPNGYQNETETKPILITNNQYIKEKEKERESRSVNYLDVEMAFMQAGGTKEMAESFFNKHTSTDWFLNGSRITKWHSLIPNYIRNWKENNVKKNGEVHPKPFKRNLL